MGEKFGKTGSQHERLGEKFKFRLKGSVSSKVFGQEYSN